MKQLLDFVDQLAQETELLEIGLSDTEWRFANTGDESLLPRMVELGMQYHAVFGSPERFQQFKLLIEEAESAGLDGELARTAQLLRNEFIRNQESEAAAKRSNELEAEIGALYTNFRGEVEGHKVSSNDIRDCLRDCDDSGQRQSYWEASKQIGPEVQPLLLELVALRNAGAREHGFRDYYDRQMQTQEIDEAELYRLLDRLEEATRAPFAAAKARLDQRLCRRFGLSGPADLRPWHYEDPFFQEAPQLQDLDLDSYFKDQNLERLTALTFERVGLNIDISLANSDLYERDGKDQGAFCLVIGRDPQQVHVLCNCRDNADWASTMLHEFGHAAYDQYLLPRQPYFLRSIAHICSTEAIAMLFGRLTYDAAWLTDILGLDAATAQELSSAAGKQLAFQMLVFTRWMMVMTSFERALYADPGQDLNRLWWDLVERYQLVQRPEGRDMPDWATKSHIAQSPVYYHNYILGELTASQMQHYIENKLGSAALIRQPGTGAWLREGLFEQGALRPWNEALEHLSGEKLNPDYFLRQFVEAWDWQA
ncbi:M2 family metallopeptidase [bacterium]|nr:M2 family metallopeptidase [bacterium]